MDRRFSDPVIVSLSSAFFSMGFFALTFSFPLFADKLHYNAGFIGFLGIFAGIPFPVFAYLMTRFGGKTLLSSLKISMIIMIPIVIIFILFSGIFFIPLVILSDLAGAAFYVSVELGIGNTDSPNLAERYSVAWGIPNLVSPAIAGAVLEGLGYRDLFILSLVFFLVSMIFIPMRGLEIRDNNVSQKGSFSIYLIMPMLFGGLSAGFFFYVMIPYLRLTGLSYILIGIIGAVPPFFSATAFIVLNRIRSENWKTYATASALLLSTPLVLFFSQSILTVGMVFAMGGFGSAIAFSKGLSYISRGSTPSVGVFYYETLFGIGFILGSLFGGLIFDYFKFVAVIAIFLPSLIYSIAVMSLGLGKPFHTNEQ